MSTSKTARVQETERTLPASVLGKDNRCPKFRFEFPDQKINPHANLTHKFTDNMFSDCFVPLFPYTMQEAYGREQEVTKIKTITLENDKVRAIIYPQYGGRIASLFDKIENRELIFDNPVFQPANLAIRNAWFSGGIEWNGPLYGHSLLTCSDVYVARISSGEGKGEGLRIYEFDRSLHTAWQVDIHLDEDSPRLWIHVKTFNLSDVDVDYYWWTNLAVPETDGTRVLASTQNSGISHTADQNIALAPFPEVYDFDGSYPARYPRADSIFFNMREDCMPWVGYVDEAGKGLVYNSTRNLCGRKFFVWGANNGGHKWMDFLSQEGKGRYIELQGGLQPTQLQTLPMKPGECFEWTECVEALNLSVEDAHHDDFFHAVECVQKNQDAAQLEELVNQRHTEFCAIAKEPIIENLWTGSAWGKIFEKRCGKDIASSMCFDGAPRSGEQEWLDFVDGTAMSADSDIGNWVHNPLWTELLDKEVAAGTAHWKHYVYLAASHIENNDFSTGQELLETANGLKETAIAWRLLATLHAREEHHQLALAAYKRTWELDTPNSDLAIVYSRYLWNQKDSNHTHKSECIALIESMPEDIRKHERIQILLAEIAFEDNDLDTVERVLNLDFSTIRECETTLSDMWFRLEIIKAERKRGNPFSDAEKKQFEIDNNPPARIDFRMLLAN